MSNDDFLNDLRGEWQSGQSDMSGAAQKVAEGIVKMQQLKWLRLAGGVAFAVLALTFGVIAWEIREPLFHLGAVVFFVAMLMTLGEFLFLRKITGEDYLSDPRSLFDKAEQQAQAAVMLEKAAISACMLLSICAMFALIYAFAGMRPVWKPLMLAAVWGGVSVSVWFRQRRRSAVAEAELEQLRSMRAELHGEG